MSDQAISPPPTNSQVQTPVIVVPNYLRWHWLLILVAESLLNKYVGGLGGAIWLLLQAEWVRKVNGHSAAYKKAVIALLLFAAVFVIGLFTGLASIELSNNNGIGQMSGGLAVGTVILVCVLLLVCLTAIVFFLMAAFELRRELEAAPFGMKLSGVMTFFFNSIYFQYHLNQWGLPGEVGGPPGPAMVTPPPPLPPAIQS